MIEPLRSPYCMDGVFMNRRGFLGSSFALPVLSSLPGFAKAAPAKPPPISRIAFGSCAVQTDPQPVWKEIQKTAPDVFMFLGDNVYADTDDMKLKAQQYTLLGKIPAFKELRSKVPIVATWDDHDFGWNDCGSEFPKKKESKQIMLNFFGENKKSPRWTREGIYTSYVFGEAPRRVQLILLDLRWSRSPLATDARGHYVPNLDPTATMLGAEQWAWLEKELQVPADIRVLGSSIQLVSSEHRWEKWANFPFEKLRLYSLIDRLGVDNMLVLSGDMHFGEISMERTFGGRRVYDFTSSGLNYSEPAGDLENSARLDFVENAANFGLVTIDWATRDIALELRSDKGAPLFKRTITL